MLVSKLSVMSHAIWWIMIPLRLAYIIFLLDVLLNVWASQHFVCLQDIWAGKHTHTLSTGCHYKLLVISVLERAYMMRCCHLAYFSSTLFCLLTSLANTTIILHGSDLNIHSNMPLNSVVENHTQVKCIPNCST